MLSIEGLAERVAATRPSESHAALLTVLRNFVPPFGSTKLATTRSDFWIDQRQVLTATGELIHDDHREYLHVELARHGHPDEVVRALRPLDYRLSHCELTKLVFVSDPGIGPPSHFTQVEVDVEREFVDRRFFDADDEGAWRDIQDINQLCDAAERGDPVPVDERRPTRAPSYRLRRVVNVAAFINAGDQLDRESRAIAAGKVLDVTTIEDGPGAGIPRTQKLTIAQLDPNLMRYAWRGLRFFDDWAASSAGRSGARLSDHWVPQVTDYTDPVTGKRTLDMVPVWTTSKKLARVATVSELYSKLEAIDRRVGVPFAWYFFMLHGNRVEPWAGERVVELAESGLIELPEHDYQVLRRWNALPYGF